MDSDGANVISLATPGGAAEFPEWTPDGGCLIYSDLVPLPPPDGGQAPAFVRTCRSGGTEVSLDADGFPFGRSGLSGLTVSPDGAEIAFSRSGFPSNDLELF